MPRRTSFRRIRPTLYDRRNLVKPNISAAAAPKSSNYPQADAVKLNLTACWRGHAGNIMSLYRNTITSTTCASAEVQNQNGNIDQESQCYCDLVVV